MPAAIPAFDAIQAWAASAVQSLSPATPVIWSRQNAPRPPRPYVTLSLDTFLAIGQDSAVGPVDDEGVRAIIGDREFTVQCGVYGVTSIPGQAIVIAETLRMSLEGWAIRAALETAGVAFVETLSVQNLDALRDPQFEGRAQLDVRFRMAAESTEAAGYITATELEYTATGGAGGELDGSDTIGTPETPPEEE